MPFLLSKNLRALRLESGLTQEALARKSGLTKDHISKIERGEQKNPRRETIEALAKALEAEPAELLYGNPRDDEGEISAASRKRAVPSAPCEVPVVGLAQAGRGGFFDDAGYPAGHGFQKIAVPEEFFQKHPHAYGVRLEGDSMLPSLKSGWVVIASPGLAVDNGNYVVAKLATDEVLVKEVSFRDGLVLLKSHNPRFEPVLASKRDFQFLHKVALIVPK